MSVWSQVCHAMNCVEGNCDIIFQFKTGSRPPKAAGSTEVGNLATERPIEVEQSEGAAEHIRNAGQSGTSLQCKYWSTTGMYEGYSKCS